MRRRSEGGSALVEVTWLSLLLIVPLLYVVLAVFETQRAAFGVAAAARSAARAYSLAPDEATGRARAQAAAAVALGDQGVEPERAAVTVTCTPDPQSCLSPGSVITVRVGTAAALPLMPRALGGDTPSIAVDATHRVAYGTFREGR